MKSRPVPALTLVGVAVLTLLVGCAGSRLPVDDNQPTLASLPQRLVRAQTEAEPGVPPSEAKTIAAYEQFLQAAPDAPQRPEALRRLGDLEMDLADRVAAEGPVTASGAPDYKPAVARYQAYLKAYPDDPRNDGVLYQLARAQEQAGQLEAALETLSLQVTRYPQTVHAAEAQFRRGELLFAMSRYPQAEQAYAAVLAAAPPGQAGPAPLQERALYMQGWSRFKQGRLDDALQAFFGVLDGKLAALPAPAREEADLADVGALARADRELLDDTFRVMSISLSNLHGAESVAPFITTPLRESYQFRVYQQLGELYIRQDRIKDAADTLAAFVRRQPLHAQAPVLQARAIAILERSGFETLALQAKNDHVLRYGAKSEFRQANPQAWQRAQPLVHAHLAELARWHHAKAQKSKSTTDVDEAVRWYRELLASFPSDTGAPEARFLLAELLFEDRRWADAAAEYETVAYGRPEDPSAAQTGGGRPHAADAGYAALLAYAALEPAADAAGRKALQAIAIASALRFAQAFAGDARSGAVLTRAAEQLYAQGEGERAAALARQSLALTPPPTPELRRTAWTVVAHQAFESGAHAEAEQAYAQALALMPERPELARSRAEITERMAAAMYRQGEAARDGGQARAAVAHFERIAALGSLPGASAVRASAQFDAAAALIGLKDWAAAARALEDFRRQQPGHALRAEVAPKLALAYLELGQSGPAAAEFDRVADQASDPALAREARWQAATLQHKAADRAPPRSPLIASAQKSWERYVSQYPQPLEAAVVARSQLAALARQDGQTARATAWLKEVVQMDAGAGQARTPRTRTLAGQAALTLADPLFEAYRQVPLVEPLSKQLKLKKARMDEVLRAYSAAADLAVAEVTTAATERTAALYQDFGRALIASTRPKKLNKAELEQYNVMLEEQAFPFEEKAIELHETNARRAATGIYDASVQRSFAALAQLKPVRWGKTERGDANLPSDLAALQAALQADPRQPRLLNQMGIAQRQLGRFEAARKAYEAAIEIDPQATDPELNLAILNDLYLGDVAQAQRHYQRCVELAPSGVPMLGKWVAELKSRRPPPAVQPAPAGADVPAAAATAAATTLTSRKETP
jgi:tetratricopeptide (TPR) repeat protein